MAVNSPSLFAFKLVKYRGDMWCIRLWNEAFGEHLSCVHNILAIVCAIPLYPFSVSLRRFQASTRSTLDNNPSKGNEMCERWPSQKDETRIKTNSYFSDTPRTPNDGTYLISQDVTIPPNLENISLSLHHGVLFRGMLENFAERYLTAFGKLTCNIKFCSYYTL